MFHDDWHGTAVVVLAGLINALQVVGKAIEVVRIVIDESGAAGAAIFKLLMKAGARQVVVRDRAGNLFEGREANMKLAAADAIAGVIGADEFHPDYIVPNVFDRRVAQAVAEAVTQVTLQPGVARQQEKPTSQIT